MASLACLLTGDWTSVKDRRGFVVINNVAYRRSRFEASRTSIKDWALFGLIMLGLAISVVLTGALIVVLVWAGTEMLGTIVRQVQGWR